MLDVANSVVKNGEVTQLIDGNHREASNRMHTNRKDIAFAGLRKEFDIALSRKLCPPIEFYIGCGHKKRIVLAIDSILIKDPETGEELQSREAINVTNNVSELKSSLKYRGWLHDEQPIFVQPAKGNKKVFC